MATQPHAGPTQAIVGTPVVVVNGAVTHALPRPELMEAIALLRAECGSVEVVETHQVADFAELWANAGSRRVVVVGGDGTVHAAANFPGVARELALIPCGSANNIARSLGIPLDPLPGGVERGPIFQAFDVGRVRFLLTDTRSQRDPQAAVDDAGKTMLGATQKEWLERELLNGRDHYALVVWVNPDPWIGAPEAGGDSWAGYATERRELSEFHRGERDRQSAHAER